MSERTAIRTGVTLAAAAIAWVLCAWLLSRTSVPSLHVSGFDEHRYFSEHALRRSRHWWAAATVVFVAIAAAFALISGWLAASYAHPLRNQALAADVRRLERVEGVSGTPVGVQNVSSWTDQANAFTTGFGPSTHVVLWDTLLDGRFSRGEEDVVIAHELGHVRSRHIIKAIGWSALIIVATFWLLGLALRSRGGVGRPENLPLVFLVLSVLALLTAPVQNVVSRRYESEADWRALRAT